MWPFKRKPDLTNDGYARWLRAQRPPFEMFLQLSELEQEALALIGDADRQDMAITLGYALHDPGLADDGLSASEGDLDAEASLAQRVAMRLINKLEGGQASRPMAPQPHVEEPAPSMGGLGERRPESIVEPPKAKKLFGKSSDQGAESA